MKQIKKAVALTLGLAMVVSAMSPVKSEAAKAPKFAKKTVSVSKGKTVTVKVNYIQKKATVTWKVKDKKVAAIVKKAKTSCKVKGVKAGSTKLTCTVKVKKKKAKNISCTVKVTDTKKKATNKPATPTPVPATDAPKETATATPTTVPTPTPPILHQTESDNFMIASDDAAADIYVDKKGKDHEGLELIAEAFQGDVSIVSSKGVVPFVADEASKVRESAIIVGSIGNNDVIDQLIADKKIDVSDIKDKKETYKIQVVENPSKDISLGLVIVGSDKRGAIYGLFHISEKMGVSPWVYWGDVTPEKKEKISFAKDSYAYTSKEPSVRYRGIFLNDEAPSLTGWASKKFKGLSENFYENVFELILRCKGNYLWPAMWGNSFSEEGKRKNENGKTNKIGNAELADKYGVVMGTSHHEPMCRAGVEWQNQYSKYGKSNAWDFNTNSTAITKFWRAGIQRNCPYENVYTVGMRGEADSALVGGLKENIDLLKNVITTQQGILKEYELEKEPQVLTVYKEVENYWHGDATTEGLKKWDVLDDTIVMLCEDNNGNMRTLPEGDQINRKGGWGMYYHFDYNGGPVSYMWMNVIQLDKVWEQMSMAYEHGIDDIWIVNVGDLKPMELPISYFLDMAYDYDKWGKNGGTKIEEYYDKWVEQQFGQGVDEEHQEEIKELLKEYTWVNTSCRPEIVQGGTYNEEEEEFKAGTYNETNYNEARVMLARLESIMERADECEKSIPKSLKAAYYQLVYYPAVAASNVAKLQICSGLNQYFYEKGSSNANLYAKAVEDGLALDKELQRIYNKEMPGVGNKWDGMMGNHSHIGYTSWNHESGKNPVPKYLDSLPAGKQMAVVVENKDNMVTTGSIDLDDFTNINEETYTVTMANKGTTAYDYTVSADKDWIELSKESGSVEQEDMFDISVDWEKVTNDATGTVTVASGDSKVTINVNAKMYETADLEEKTYIYANGYASILPGNFVNSGDSENGDTVFHMPGYGKMEDSVKIQPAITRYAKDVTKAPYVEYRVALPKDGDYKLAVYSAPSGNLERDDVSINYGLSVNNGKATKISTIMKDYAAENYSSSWPTDIRMSGRKSESTVTMKAGVNTVRIYLADPAFVLQKLVISEERVKESHFGPRESYYVGKEEG